MADPQVRIFPHSREKEFPSEDYLRSWLLCGLRGRGGVYRLRRKDAVAELPIGSIVLFRYDKVIVGEAVVCNEKLDVNTKDTTLLGEEQEYEAQVTFAPSSIRLYAPPFPVEKIRTEKDLIKFAGAYAKLEWSIYACILRDVVSSGAFIS